MTSTQTNPSSAWSDQTLENPHEREDKSTRVRDMFGAIARSYDLNNRVHSLWRDEAWRRAAVRGCDVNQGDRVLDLACGTGDLAQAFAKMTRAGHVTGADFTPEMLDLARHKQDNLNDALADRITYEHADAMDLQYDDASFDVLSIAFGIRNVQDPTAAIKEFYRVLKPGGRLVILEFDRPRLVPVRWFNAFYCQSVMPRTATWIARDTSGAYKYLPRSVATFLTSSQLASLVEDSGFVHDRTKTLSMGIAACLWAHKPA